jgi:hypothetical protein
VSCASKALSLSIITMSSRAMEQTFCLDSFNRDTTIYIDPNNFVLDLKGRYEVQYANLASVEMPLSQYIIEKDWSGFEFDVGISFFERQCRTATVVLAPGEAPRIEVVLPPPVAQLVGLGGNLWQTADAAPHGLFQATLSVTGFSASVLFVTDINLPRPVTVVPASNQVVGPTNNFGDYAVLVVGNAGARSFTGPHQLSDVLNAAFSALGWPARFSYSAHTNRAEITAPPGFVLGDIPGAVLSRSLGFVCRPGSGITHFPAFSDNFPAAKRVVTTIAPGNYEPSSLRSTLETLLNPLATAASVPMEAIFYIEVFEKVGGRPVAVTVPSMRSYHPRGISKNINNLIAAAGLPLISFNFDHDRYRFDTMATSPPFVIFWGPTSADQDLATRLGFDQTPTSLSRHAVGAPRNYVDLPTSVSMPLVYEGESINLIRHFVFSARPRVQRAPFNPIVVTSDGINLTAPVGSVPLEYLLLINGSFFALAQRIDGDSVVLVPLGNVPLEGGVYGALIVPVLSASFNIYMLLHPRSCYQRLAEIIGLRQGQSGCVGRGGGGGVTSSVSPPGALVAPNVWNFEGPPYVLLDLGLQHMSALMNQRCKEDLRTQFLGKIVLYPSFKMDRGIPMAKSGTGVSVVSQLEISVMNPWHQPYVFHGREWSLTVVFGAATQSARTQCP